MKVVFSRLRGKVKMLHHKFKASFCALGITSLYHMQNISLMHLLSISSTFYARILRQYFCAKKFQIQNTAFSEPKISYKKCAHKMQMKLTPELALKKLHLNHAFLVLHFNFSKLILIYCKQDKLNKTHKNVGSE
jgi:hypothetical protein